LPPRYHPPGPRCTPVAISTKLTSRLSRSCSVLRGPALLQPQPSGLPAQEVRPSKNSGSDGSSKAQSSQKAARSQPAPRNVAPADIRPFRSLGEPQLVSNNTKGPPVLITPTSCIMTPTACASTSLQYRSLVFANDTHRCIHSMALDSGLSVFAIRSACYYLQAVLSPTC
jgi:hypothetical protein